ncbi:acetylornithine transaminase [Motilibacter deserti]|uniref:Acetylornithine aminotransferase n=1 Tax=Motilibacter deserti TaxID=2714956 RepID=A0ABX0GU45_9ACTN|nr:acetylornithine transaminase [Motilibacter deserti]NHC14065.1 acetylornithine transaminase [Motilibacter deserti]
MSSSESPTTTRSVVDRWSSAVMPTYATPGITLVRGSGAVVEDDAGRSYVDLIAGIATNVLGHAHPAVVRAVTDQVGRLGHTSNLYANLPSVTLAERLLGLLGREGKVFFCNSGAEANEAALKLTRRTGRTKVVAAYGSFHGRTMGALALTGQPLKQEPFAPLVPGVVHVEYGDVAALRRAVDDSTAAVFLEPVQGEGGVLPAPAGYLAAAREATTAAGALLVLDEVQTGIGRTGAWFAHQSSGVRPDVVTLAKGLGGGLPLGACIGLGEAAALLRPGDHASTFGGNPVTCAAGLAVLDTLAADDLCSRAKSLGHHLAAGIEALAHPLVAGVRGEGLLLGVTLRARVAPVVVDALRESGFLVNAVAHDVIRLAPPLVLTDEQADSFLAALPAALDAALAAARDAAEEAVDA